MLTKLKKKKNKRIIGDKVNIQDKIVFLHTSDKKKMEKRFF